MVRSRALMMGAALLVEVACGGGAPPDGTALAELKNKSVLVTGVQGQFLYAQLSADGCPVLRPDATATLNGRPIALGRGKYNPDPPPGMGPCYSPLAAADLQGETATTLSLTLSDPSQTVAVTIANYHPFGFAPGELTTTTVQPRDTVTLAAPRTPETADLIQARFYATNGPPSTASWVVPATLLNGEITFSIPADSPTDTGDLEVCGSYSVATMVQSCGNATCELSQLTGGDCRSYAISIVAPAP
jgi:hypothetical protein